jgi:hypothetical protein
MMTTPKPLRPPLAPLDRKLRRTTFEPGGTVAEELRPGTITAARERKLSGSAFRPSIISGPIYLSRMSDESAVAGSGVVHAASTHRAQQHSASRQVKSSASA